MSLSASETLRENLGSLFSFAPVNGFTRVRTPFLYPDGDIIDLFLQERDGCHPRRQPCLPCWWNFRRSRSSSGAISSKGT
jgi:hypothetical protein